MTRDGDTIFVADVHIDRGDPDLPAFLAFLERIADRARRVVVMGDLFNLWIGKRRIEQPHQTAVLERLAALRSRGIVVRYVEGNRDYRVGPDYAGAAFDDVSEEGIEETSGGTRIFAIHGDLANPADRRYRVWRRVSRSEPVWRLFHLLPPRTRIALGEWIERRLRTTNLEMKSGFPEPAVRAYAATFLARGFDAVVLGHFHEEHVLEARSPSSPGRIYVLPDWKSGRRFLRVTPGGEIAFESDRGSG